VAFKIARAIFSLAIWLIDRFAINMGARRTSALVVRIDIIYVNDETGISHIRGERRIKMMLCGDAV